MVMEPVKNLPSPIPETLCLRCGLCCDGTLFRDVELQPTDDPIALANAGLPLERFRRQEEGKTLTGRRFPQPCSALGTDCRCRVYTQRPEHCRGFDCALLQSFKAGSLEPKMALKTIRQTRQRADQVRRLLQELGDTEPQLSLTKRVQRMQRKVFAEGLPSGQEPELAAERFGDLLAAVGELQLALRLAFYPDGSR